MPESAYTTQPATFAASRPGPLSTAALPDGARTVVTVCGELDLHASDELSAALGGALESAAEGIDLDLQGVVFCDCSALNVLLALREQALTQGKTVTIQASSPAAERLLTLTGTLRLFTGAAHDETGEHELGTEVVQLRRAMQTRPTIDLARGVLMATFGLSPQDAWHVLVMVSQNTNTKLHLLAQDLVTAVQGEPLPDATQRQVSAAVSRLSESGVGAPGHEGA
ncbi:ANTAR domain-containing protein [Streptomyces sp. NPDC047706]|uniref:ANTAR domain-containing protein n=1 Tax=Streptomyces sp. NPDC047706 TaxID=3365486 RepID=UPI00371464A4